MKLINTIIISYKLKFYLPHFKLTLYSNGVIQLLQHSLSWVISS